MMFMMLMAAIVPLTLLLITEILSRFELVFYKHADYFINRALDPYNDGNIVLGKQTLGPRPHPPGYNSIHSLFCQILREESRLMPGIRDLLLMRYLSVLYIYNSIGRAPPKMGRHITIFCRNSYSHNFLLSEIICTVI
jgi:hypothetical protein